MEVLEEERYCYKCGAALQADKRFVLVVDLDGVVADFYEALRPFRGGMAWSPRRFLDEEC